MSLLLAFLRPLHFVYRKRVQRYKNFLTFKQHDMNSIINRQESYKKAHKYTLAKPENRVPRVKSPLGFAASLVEELRLRVFAIIGR